MRDEFKTRCILFSLFLAGWCLLSPHVAGHVTAGDSAELALAGASLGIAHSPGYPVFTIINNALSRLIPFGNSAFKQNLISCLLACLSLVMLGGLMIRLTRLKESAYLSLVLVLWPFFRHQAFVTEVFSLTLFWGLLVIFCLLRFADRRQGIFLVSFLMGMGVGVHQTLLLLSPGLLFLYWKLGEGSARTKSKDLLLCAPFFLLGWSVHLALFIRSTTGPLLDWEDPQTWSRFWGLITRKRYGILQLAQGEVHRSLSSLFGAFQHLLKMMINNLGWLGMGMTLLSSSACLGWSRSRRLMGGIGILVFFSGPFFFWLANVSVNESSDILNRFGLLPLVLCLMLISMGLGILWTSEIRLYRCFSVVLIVGLAIELFMRHPISLRAEPLRDFTGVLNEDGSSMRWDLSVREGALNILRELPESALLFADRANEAEFSLAYLLGYEKRKPGVRFVDCNAGVTRSVYGDDYYGIWGQPRLRRRERIEKRMIQESRVPVYYITDDPHMINIFRMPWGLLYRAWTLKSIHEPKKFLWSELVLWRFHPREFRSRVAAQSAFDPLARCLFDLGYYKSAERMFGILQTMGGPHRKEQMGFMYQKRGSMSRARKSYRAALIKGLSSAALYTNLGAIEVNRHNLQEAEKLYSEGLSKFPRALDLNYNAGVLYWRKKDWREAAKFFERVLKLNPHHSDAKRLLSLARGRQKLSKQPQK